MGNIRGWAAHGPRQKLEPFCYDAGPLGAEEVEVAVEYCGLCHSDLSIINNDWGVSRYPVVPGHEAVGTVVSAGPGVRGVKVGQRVGVGWNVDCCMHCRQCLMGNHHLCLQVMPTIIGHYGAFARESARTGYGQFHYRKSSNRLPRVHCSVAASQCLRRSLHTE